MSTAPLKSYDLKQSAPAGDTNPANTHFSANGRRITRVEFDTIKRAAVRHDSFSTVNVNGVVTHYSVAYVPFSFFLSLHY